MFVFAQVSSMKTRRLGSILPCRCCHCRRLRATFGRSCSLACRLFFKAEAGTIDNVPQGKIADLDAAAFQFGQQCTQRQIWLLRDPFENAVTFLGQGKGPIPTRRLCRNATLFSIQPCPSLHGRLADLEHCRRLKPAHTRAERCHNAFSQIQCVRSAHGCWPPTQPASWNRFLAAPESTS